MRAIRRVSRGVVMGSRSDRSGCRPGASAFSLLEVLVVVAIVAALIAVLLPALAGAMRAEARVRCLANLHQIGLAFRLYADDHDGLPPDQEALDTWDVLLTDYLAEDRFFLCPSDDSGLDEMFGNSYAWRDDYTVDEPGASLANRSLLTLSRTDLVLVFDAEAGWHGEGSVNAATVDAAAKSWDAEAFLENLNRPIE